MKKYLLILTIISMMLSLPLAFAHHQQCPQGSVVLDQSDFTSATLVINAPGVYCLDENVNVYGDWIGVEIASDDVEFNLNGHAMYADYDPENPGGSDLPGVAFSTRDFNLMEGGNDIVWDNIYIHNGEIRDFKYFSMIVKLSNSVIENLKMSDNGIYGLLDKSQVNNNVFSASLNIPIEQNINSGIVLSGSYSDIIGNTFYHLNTAANITFSLGMGFVDNTIYNSLYGVGLYHAVSTNINDNDIEIRNSAVNIENSQEVYLYTNLIRGSQFTLPIDNLIGLRSTYGSSDLLISTNEFNFLKEGLHLQSTGPSEYENNLFCDVDDPVVLTLNPLFPVPSILIDNGGNDLMSQHCMP